MISFFTCAQSATCNSLEVVLPAGGLDIPLVNRNNNCDAARALHTDVRPSHKKLVDRETAKDVTMSPINMRTVVFKIMLFAYKIRRALRQ
ncbi:hypothetical protein V9T40_014908 [Parthenolecanium corni]|uniref:Uncharacterized protein n=1 Tax=Parthenolecanium corni TaxID=536013 RepID=A0AAN9Y5X8_9HEMI